MSDVVDLPLTSGEMRTVVYGLLELRRVLTLSSIVDPEATHETDNQITTILEKAEAAITNALQETRWPGGVP
jgi:hypothetical protein